MRGLVYGVLCVAFVLLLGGGLQGQEVDITAPLNMGWCEQATFVITVTNTSSQTMSQIVITNTRPHADFTYVPGTSVLTLHDGTVLTADPTFSGLDLIWDIDAILGSSYELPPGEKVTLEFDLATTCSTLSGTDTVRVDFLLDGIHYWVSDSQGVEILPGAVLIYKEPSVIHAHVGDTVTWTITVESFGLGPIHNVVVTDSLGVGLSFVSANPAPDSVVGHTIIWNLGSIPAGETR